MNWFEQQRMDWIAEMAHVYGASMMADVKRTDPRLSEDVTCRPREGQV